MVKFLEQFLVAGLLLVYQLQPTWPGQKVTKFVFLNMVAGLLMVYQL